MKIELQIEVKSDKKELLMFGAINAKTRIVDASGSRSMSMMMMTGKTSESKKDEHEPETGV
jgi:hypothetical protein